MFRQIQRQLHCPEHQENCYLTSVKSVWDVKKVKMYAFSNLLWMLCCTVDKDQFEFEPNRLLVWSLVTHGRYTGPTLSFADSCLVLSDTWQVPARPYPLPTPSLVLSDTWQVPARPYPLPTPSSVLSDTWQVPARPYPLPTPSSVLSDTW